MNPIAPIVLLTFTLQSVIPVPYLNRSLSPAPTVQISPSIPPAVPLRGANGGINSASDLRSSPASCFRKKAGGVIRKSRPHLQYSYTYDPVGNRLTVAAPNGIHNYTYNNIYELTSVAGAQNHSYQYDTLGNRTTADSINYTSNNLNQYTQVSVNPYRYDGNGNLIDDNHATYTYDAENRMTVSTNQPYTTYQYDGLGRRIQKNIDNDRITYFVYDGDRIIEERYDNGGLAASYVYGDGIDEVLTMNRNGETFYYFMDGLGSVTDIVNNNGEVVENYSYDVYGAPNHTSTIGNPFYFTGRELDESGLYNYRARVYNPAIGRFMQRDPIGYYDSMNLFKYVGNNSINWIDSFGLTQEQIDMAYDWIKTYHPGLVNENFKLIDKSLSSDEIGFTNPITHTIYIDTNKINKAYGGQEWIVSTVAHELMHAKDSLFESIYLNLVTGGQYHSEIYRKAAEIQIEYREWEYQEKEAIQCK